MEFIDEIDRVLMAFQHMTVPVLHVFRWKYFANEFFHYRAKVVDFNFAITKKTDHH